MQFQAFFLLLHKFSGNRPLLLRYTILRKRGRCKIDEKSSMEQRLPFYVKKQKTDPEEPVIYGIIRYDQ